MSNTSAKLAVLAEPMRTAIMEQLGRRPMAVGALAELLPISRPAVSQHLAALKREGLVRAESMGTSRVYSIDPQGLGAIRAWLDQFWEMNLAAYVEAAEAESNR